MYIEIGLKDNGKFIREIEEPNEENGLTWMEIAYEFGNVLRGFGYHLPEDWDNFLSEQEYKRKERVGIVEKTN